MLISNEDCKSDYQLEWSIHVLSNKVVIQYTSKPG